MLSIPITSSDLLYLKREERVWHTQRECPCCHRVFKLSRTTRMRAKDIKERLEVAMILKMSKHILACRDRPT